MSSDSKILFVTRPLSPPWDEASKNFAYDLACTSHHHTITILVDKLIKNAPAHIIQKKIYSTNTFSALQKIRLFFFLLTNIRKYNIIHLLFTPTKLNCFLMRCILFFRTNRTHVVQTIATVRDDLYSPNELKRMFFGDTLVTYSSWAQKKLLSYDISPVTHIYPGINLTKYKPEQKNLSLCKKWNISKNDLLITYPGEFTRLGATDLIINAFLQLWKNPQFKHVKYICACRIKNTQDAQKKDYIIKKLKNTPHYNKVIFTDTYADMNSIYNLSDIILFPVKNMKGKFDVPLAMIEPYACKKPVITSNLSLFKEFSDISFNVILPDVTISTLCTTMQNLIIDKKHREKLGENAYHFVHKTFNINTITQQYEKIYKKNR